MKAEFLLKSLSEVTLAERLLACVRYHLKINFKWSFVRSPDWLYHFYIDFNG